MKMMKVVTATTPSAMPARPATGLRAVAASFLDRIGNAGPHPNPRPAAPAPRPVASSPRPLPWDIDFRDDTEARRIAALRELAAVSDSILTFKRQIADARLPVDRLTAEKASAQRRVSEVEAALHHFDSLERQALEKWAESCEGDRPARRAEDREHLERARDGALRDLAHVEATLQQHAQRLKDIQEGAGALNNRVDGALVDVLLEEAEILGHRYVTALDQVAEIASELIGINDALLSFRHVVVQRRDVPPGTPVPASNPGILSTVVDLDAFQIETPAFALRATRYKAFFSGPTMDGIGKAARRWLEFASALVTRADDDESDIRERQRAIVENANLKAQLAALPPSSEGDSSC